MVCVVFSTIKTIQTNKSTLLSACVTSPGALNVSAVVESPSTFFGLLSFDSKNHSPSGGSRHFTQINAQIKSATVRG